MEIPIQLKNLKFCKIKKGTKKPFEKDWTNKPYSHEEISQWLKENDENYGILCGFENLAVIDSDNEALQIAIENMLPATYKVKTGSGKGTHNYYFIKDLDQKLILELEDGTHLGEVQWKGQQVVGAGSIHPSGRTYQESDTKPIAEISASLIYECFKPFIKQIKETEENVEFERKEHSEIDDLNVASIWGLSGLKKNDKGEYYGSHPIHSSSGGINFWINPSKNLWHCFRCQSGGGPLSAIAVKEGVIDCSEARRGNLRGSKAFETIELAHQRYGLLRTKPITNYEDIRQKEQEIKIIWEHELPNYVEEEKEWIIEKLIPTKSICILTGKRGTMKTFVALNMAYAVASGSDFLNKYTTRKGGIIYLDKENGIGIMKDRTAMVKKGMELIGKKLNIGFICFSQLKIDKLGDMIAIEKVIETQKPLLLIVDTYRRGISFDENDAGEVSKLFVDTLRPLVEKYDLSIILIHHDRKSGERDEMDTIRGSSDLANYSDIILRMVRNKGELILKQLKNRNAPEEQPIKIHNTFDETELKMWYEGEFIKKNQAQVCLDAILVWITENNLQKFELKEVKELALTKGFKKNSLFNALLELQNNGLIKNVGRGKYEIPQK
jgi:RecA-family ATPase